MENSEMYKRMQNIITQYKPTSIAGIKLDKNKKTRTLCNCIVGYENIPISMVDCIRADEVSWDDHHSIIISCFEIHDAEDRFVQFHGHSFIGNANYYVMPKVMCNKFKNDIPEHIGLIAYISDENFEGLRCVRECQFQNVSDNKKAWTLLSLLKKEENLSQAEIAEMRLNKMYHSNSFNPIDISNNF